MAEEDTQKLQDQLGQTDEALIAEMLSTAKGIDLPSDLKTNPVIHKGDETLPAPMTVTEIRSGKYFWIYETETGEPVPCLGYMLRQKLMQKLPNGNRRFTAIDPGYRPKRGTIKCALHAESPERKHYDELGFATCRKSNIRNLYQLEQHMKKRHPQEWGTIEKERLDKERQEDRHFQQLMMSQIARSVEAKSEQATEEKSKFVCETCGKEFAYGKAYRRHRKTCK